ncbi:MULTISPECIES: flagellar hook protein FlgE [Rhizobium]|jgi:flagellar hook protein FlgE|uniref:Flagellar hook protein FlgE n=1 Tax=Rhizobium soli TaxID=424798 RepID=A0A7X0JHK1_9HYPH|nr:MULTISPECIES: flagellar hook protein FlgE [Rhizobium]KQQ73715.1 flagellar biosynthesis protein FlgE [Rhizobium sp. Leaf321]MBB6507715.1 flagellar hook protein FlgE [Rhizobium soli]MBP2463472.1 flagellar hook protein FlgE [Rhizobium sp. PvP014]MBP2530867.1 flagellar hook protein FlgE [Rhizobium sp. PvP099]
MSLFGTMKTAVSGMNAQANRLGTVGDNIANSSTTAYKKSSTQFASLVLPSTAGSYNSGGVETSVKYSISEQGALEYTTSGSDLAIQGDGFFVVQNSAGETFLTRSGDFTPNEQGNLVNSAGYTLLGYSYDSGTPTTVVNSYDGLVPINVGGSELSAVASTSGSLSGNLNSASDVVAADLPADNTEDVDVDMDSTLKTSLTSYDSLGNPIVYDFYFSKTAAGEWQLSVYNAADASTTGTGSFPYGGDGELANLSLAFNSSGKLETVDGAEELSVTVNGIKFDLAGMTQLSAKSNISSGSVNGSAPSSISSVKIESDGTINAVYADGSSKSLYQIAMATVESPDNLEVSSGNVYRTTSSSGVVTLGFAGSSGFGEIVSGALETSNVDLANELTEMIEAQRSYSANSKVFQTGSDLMDVLINLVR